MYRPTVISSLILGEVPAVVVVDVGVAVDVVDVVVAVDVAVVVDVVVVVGAVVVLDVAVVVAGDAEIETYTVNISKSAGR